MTKEQLQDIRNKLKIWSKERHLSVMAQQENLLGNILEELTEAARAKTIDDKVDAICDIMVFYLNATDSEILICPDRFDYIGVNFAWRILTQLSVNSITNHPLNQCVTKLRKMGYDPYLCLLEVVNEISSRTGSWDEDLGKFKKDPGVYYKHELELDYPDDKIEEYEDTYRVLTDKQIFTFKKWYKADYSKCRLK